MWALLLVSLFKLSPPNPTDCESQRPICCLQIPVSQEDEGWDGKGCLTLHEVSSSSQGQRVSLAQSDSGLRRASWLWLLSWPAETSGWPAIDTEA